MRANDKDSKMSGGGSFYDQFAVGYESPQQQAPATSSAEAIKKARRKFDPESPTPHQNRDDGDDKYSSSFNKKAATASTVPVSNSNSNNEWMKLICNRATVDPTAIIVNLSFTRNLINGDNFIENRDKYFRLYSEQSAL